MNEIIFIGIAVALVCSLAGAYFTVKKEYHESSLAWNGATVILCFVLLAAYA